jgi:putative ABC transport system permease protein
MTRIPLAWKNLTHDKRKLALALAGIGFAVVLMFQQRGFQLALFDSTVEIVRELDADIILVNPARFALTNEIRFPRRLLDVAASAEGVSAVEPVYFENIRARLRREGFRPRPIRVVAFDLDKPVWLDLRNEVLPQKHLIRNKQTALIDRLSKSSYRFSLGSKAEFPQMGELNGKEIRLMGSFQSGRDFAHEGNLLMSSQTFSFYFPQRGADPLELVDLGLIKLQPGFSVDETIGRLQSLIGIETRILSKQQFMNREIDFWARNTPIGIIFLIGTVIGFVVGVIICYQILANDIADHLGEFATLKAMGYGSRYFVGMVIQQALYLALLGFLPGLLVTELLFQLNSEFTGLLMRLSTTRVLVVFLATLTMCLISGLLALRKLLWADPASLF